MKIIRQLSVLVLCLFSACGGGGGGGGGSAFYGGLWRFAGVNALNDCNIDIPVQVIANLTVNQDGERVVVDSGNVVLEGTTNEEDGFAVAHSGVTENGCALALAYVFKDASDGEADTGFAIVSRCGSLQCSVAYGGTSLRSGRANIDDSDAATVDEVIEVITGQIGHQTEGKSSGEEELHDLAEELAARVVPGDL